MSPDAAVSALSDRLTKEDSSFKASFKDSIYTTSVFDLQKKVVADAKDASYVFSHKANTESDGFAANGRWRRHGGGWLYLRN